MVGIITKLRLRVEPEFNLAVKVDYKSDATLGKGRGPIDYVRDCDYGQLLWFPGRHRVVRMCGTRTAEHADDGATNRLLKPDFQRWMSGPAERALHYGTCDASFSCRVLESARYNQLRRSPPLYKIASNGKEKSFHHVVGPSSRMMSSELTLAQQGILQHDFELAIPASRAAEAFAAAREHFAREEACLPLVGVFIRFARIEDEAWIAHTGASDLFEEGEFAVFFEMPIYVPEGVDDETVKAYLRPYSSWVRRLIEDFGARPHWAKNDDWVFDIQDPGSAYGPRWETFRGEVSRLDPDGVFANRWSVDRGLRDRLLVGP